MFKLFSFCGEEEYFALDDAQNPKQSQKKYKIHNNHSPRTHFSAKPKKTKAERRWHYLNFVTNKKLFFILSPALSLPKGTQFFKVLARHWSRAKRGNESWERGFLVCEIRKVREFRSKNSVGIGVYWAFYQNFQSQSNCFGTKKQSDTPILCPSEYVT